MMSNKRTQWIVVAAFLVAVLPALPAHAWIITQINPDPNAGLASAQVVSFGNTDTSNVFELDKFFMADPAGATARGPITLSFIRQPGDLDAITIVDEMILNMQQTEGQAWSDYHVAIVNDPLVLFAGGAATFINPGAAVASQTTGGPSRLGGTPFSFTSTQINWQDANQTVPPGAFSDAPTNQLTLNGLAIDVSALSAGEGFFLKEWPTVAGVGSPEPASLALLGFGGLAALLRRRK